MCNNDKGKTKANLYRISLILTAAMIRIIDLIGIFGPFPSLTSLQLRCGGRGVARGRRGEPHSYFCTEVPWLCAIRANADKSRVLAPLSLW